MAYLLTMRKFLQILGVLTVLLADPAQLNANMARDESIPTKSGDTLLFRARWVTGVPRTAESVSLLVRDGRIVQVFPARLVPRSRAGFELIDMTGKWLISGLHDLHVHSWGNPSPTHEDFDQMLHTAGTLKVMALAGITAILDLGSDENEILPLRDEQRTKGLDGATLYSVGGVWVQVEKLPEGKHGVRFVTGVGDVKQQMDEFAAKKPDFVKVIYDHSGTKFGMVLPVLQEIIAQAHAHNLRVITHIALWQDAREALQAGADAFTHLDDATDIPDDITQLLISHKACVIPTMGVQAEVANLADDPTLLDAPLLRAVATPELLKSYRDIAHYISKASFWLKWQRESRQTFLRSIAKLFKSGACVLLGSDTGNLGLFQGYSAHREAQMYAKAGVPIHEILYAATIAPARFLGESPNTADLVVLNKDPLLSVDNWMDIHSVYVRGKLVPRAQWQVQKAYK